MKFNSAMLLVYELDPVIFKAIKNNMLKVRDGVEALKAIGSLGIAFL